MIIYYYVISFLIYEILKDTLIIYCFIFKEICYKINANNYSILMADAGDELVYLKCIHDGKKLRIRITSDGYYPFANCSYPREIRVKDRCYTIPSYDIMLKAGKRGTFFYVLEPSSITIIPNKIFYDKKDPNDCIICLTNEKNVAFTPCGHFCCCNECYAKLEKKCPLCRSIIDGVITKDKLPFTG